MIRIFVNGISAKSAGGRAILMNFLEVARTRNDEFQYIVTTPSLDAYDRFASDRIKIIPMGWRSRTPLIPLASIFQLPRYARKYQCEAVFNLSDIPMRTQLPQIFLFDWPYAIYMDSPAWKLMRYKDLLVRSFKLYVFKRLLTFVDLTIAQTELVRSKLVELYRLSPVFVVGNSHHIETVDMEKGRDFELGDGFKALCISRYYSHKNLEIMIPLAHLIKNNGHKIKIILTINPNESAVSKNFIKSIKKNGLDDIIVNLGTIDIAEVFSLFRQTDALLLPTVLETLGLTYFEAMHCDRLILTSDLPFAHAVCGDAAIYFDPFDAQDIFAKLREAVADQELAEEKIQQGREIIRSLPTWEDAYTSYTQIFKVALGI